MQAKRICVLLGINKQRIMVVFQLSMASRRRTGEKSHPTIYSLPASVKIGLTDGFAFPLKVLPSHLTQAGITTADSQV
jgi:hypothetical protein